MKFSAILAFAGIVAITLAAPPSEPSKCEYECTKLDLPVCGHNGMCLNNFQSLCTMEEYNCVFPQRPFVRTDDWKCAERSLPQCTPGDFFEE